MSAARVVLTFGTLPVPLEVTTSSDQTTVRVRDAVLTVALEPVGSGMFAVTCDGRRFLVHHASDGSTHYLHVDGETYAFERGPAEGSRPATAAGHHDVRAPMPGVVTQVFVAEGQAVSAGDPLYVVEAMKIETVIRASSPCRIGRVRVTPGTQVEGGAVVVEVESLES